ncbi:mechanosensitive ion channel protein MscS [Mycolicibacterium chubuense]|uniref:Miniconductance mechanosensitive channel MscM n=1 Tax=Mycolicibacterium chubuense TaxID=1800 RepID=A0A0J6VSL4_MYCCU|nr:mechanosensitive ion channel domain-containing protein [Mycolicibacterium chubuense]KMO73159.1 Miniconductance mechanosensitive channel MscM precursor [Mycolicibacterium chubuense]ORA43071.1 mechanosensitive ion channel protein MscS [Mycolicibacterium chubuense]SPX98696.1 small-conductance mechanosensitive channel [Mycolicibacterium chubuense]
MDDPTFAPATHLATTAAWVAGAVGAAYVLGLALSWLLQRLGRRSRVLHDVADLTRRPLRATLVVIAAAAAVRRASDGQAAWRGWLDHLLVIALIGTVTWMVTSLVLVAERQVIDRFAGGDTGLTDADRHRRKIRTQVTTLRRLAVAIVVVLGAAAALMTFPSFSDVGKTMFASAGVLTVVAGLAAQTSLGSVFAGIQIAFSDAIRVGDVVVLEEEWGRIEEITLTYVVVHLWDERRLVLPCTYFTTTPFQNWTRNATQLLGTAELDVDFTVPFDAMRAELDRLLRANPKWDGRVGVLQVTDAVEGLVRVRMLVSAPDAGQLFDLRCDVREGMVAWLQQTIPCALPRQRIEHQTDGDRAEGSDAVYRDAPQADSGLFSGSADAERRGRAFEKTG